MEMSWTPESSGSEFEGTPKHHYIFAAVSWVILSHLWLVPLALNFTSLPLRRSLYICGHGKSSLLDRANNLDNITSRLESIGHPQYSLGALAMW